MKPVLGMESEKPAVVSMTGIPVQEVSNKEKWSSSKKVVVGVIIGLVTLVTIATVIGLSFYFGAKVTHDNYKEAHQTFHTEDGRVVEEETKVTETEVDIKLPNQRESIFDYTHGLVVERMYDSKTGMKSACYARYMNETVAPSTNADNYNNGDLYLSKTDESTTSQTKKWVSTTKKVPYHMISDSVAKMCAGTDVFWMEEIASDAMVKRETCYEVYYTYVCYPTDVTCLYYCYLTYYCVTDSNVWYISREVEGYYTMC